MWRVALRPIASCCYLWFFSGCSPDSLRPTEYVQYIRNPKHGFIEHHEQSDIFIQAFYQPPEYAALMQIAPEDMNDSLFTAELGRGSSFYHFMLSVGSNSEIPIDEALRKALPQGGASFEDKKIRMLYNIQNSFALVTGKDSLPCVFYHAQSAGKVDNAYHFTLAFESDSSTMKAQRNTDLVLIYKDSLWLQKRIEFVFDKNKINQSPSIKL